MGMGLACMKCTLDPLAAPDMVPIRLWEGQSQRQEHGQEPVEQATYLADFDNAVDGLRDFDDLLVLILSSLLRGKLARLLRPAGDDRDMGSHGGRWG